MNFEHNHKTIVYIILGIVVIFALGVYIYITLSNAPVVPVAPAATSTAHGGLTPEQAAAKQALITSQLAAQKPQPLTTAQASSKAALLKAQMKANN